jgi:hypothetical protein
MKINKVKSEMSKAVFPSSDSSEPVFSTPSSRRVWPYLLTALAASAISLAIAIPVTLHSAQQAGTSAYEENSPLFLASSLAKYYYPSSVGTLVSGDDLLADFYYAFNSEQEEWIVVSLSPKTLALTFSDAKGQKSLSSASASLSLFTYSGFSLELTYTAKLAQEERSGTYSLSLKPFYDSLI